MQASLDALSLKHLTRALTCLSKYGDDMVVYATRQHLALSATNSSLSAYCRFKYSRQFFSRYTVQEEPNWDAKDDTIRVSGQLLVKSLLSILKPATAAKSVERCELTFVEGGAAQQLDAEEGDSLESRLIVRLYCKHGVVKTHRLLLNDAANLMVPGLSNSPQESKLSVGARSLKDLLDHFPIAKGPKSDPQIIWVFNDDEVILKGLESSLDTSVKGQLATELSVSPAEFDVYDVYEPPLTVGLHLREFMATIMFAESLALNLDLRFTEPAAPLFIDIDGDLSETLFVISTNQVREEDIPSGVQPRVHAPSREESMQPRGRKRELESAEPEAHGHDEAGVHARGTVTPSSARKKPQKVVVHADRDSVARELQGSQCRSSVVRSMPPPSLPPHSMNPLAPPQVEREPLFLPGSQVEREPLFLPGSQVPLSQAAEAAIRASGLGIENMTVDEFAAMMEDEGEEVGAGAPAEDAQDAEMGEERDELEDEIMRESSFDLYEDTHTEFAPTQGDVSAKTFRPLFDD